MASGFKNDESEGNSEYDEDDGDQCDGGTLQGKLNNVEVEAPTTPVEQVNFLKAPICIHENRAAFLAWTI